MFSAARAGFIERYVEKPAYVEFFFRQIDTLMARLVNVPARQGPPPTPTK